jgi:hypothetical protein
MCNCKEEEKEMNLEKQIIKLIAKTNQFQFSEVDKLYKKKRSIDNVISLCDIASKCGLGLDFFIEGGMWSTITTPLNGDPIEITLIKGKNRYSYKIDNKK